MGKNTAGGEWSLSCAVVLGHSECLIHAQRARVRVKERHRGFGFVSRKSTSVVIIAEKLRVGMRETEEEYIILK